MAGGKQDLYTVSLCEEIRPDYESYQIYHCNRIPKISASIY